MNIANNKLLLSGVIILIMALTFVAINNDFTRETEPVITQTLIKKCIPQNQACVVNIGDLKLTVSFEKNIYYLKSFNIMVSSENNTDLTSINVDFKMKNMSMGINRFQLKRSINKSHHWQGKALLPICVTGRVDWTSELDVMTSKERYRFIFPLFVQQPVK